MVKQLLILSGKGGTGKTTLSSAFIKLSQARASADCDVDAPNLHLVMGQIGEPERRDYYGLPQAEISRERCNDCGVCELHCRFEAIVFQSGYKVDPFACEGCGLCAAVCPNGAVALKPAVAGALMRYSDTERVFATAQLKMGSGNSGKLVTEVKNLMRKSAPETVELAIIDGSPGLGCPVIASLSGVDLVLIVAEPSLAGLSDLERIVETARLFQVRIAVCVNKSDVNLGLTREIIIFCEKKRIPFAGEVPFDPEAVRAVNEGLTIVDADCPSGAAAREVFVRVKNLLLADDSHQGLKMYTGA